MPSSTDSSFVPLPTLHQKILKELRHAVRREHFETWFRGVRLERVEGTRFVMTVPSVFVRDWLRRNYLGLMESAARTASGLPKCEVVLRLDRGEAGREGPGRSEGALAGYESVAGDQALAGEEARLAAEGLPGAETIEGDDRLDRHGAPAEPLDMAGEADSGDAYGHGRTGGSAGRSRSPGDGSFADDFGRSRNPRDDSFGTLNTNYTFEQFVVGPCNRLAHAAALAVGDNPGRAYNPLFIHGNVGLGKTHLLQATCHAIRRRRGEAARVLYLSCEAFTNRFILSIRAGKLEEFREFHRSVDVLVIDDVQFLANKEKTQDEFFHTFNALYNSNRQIIISSDRSPTEIPTIEERLVSRFKWGLVAEMELPCFETRVAIVKRKARTRQVEMPDDVAYCIAERIDTNIRELEGAVIKVVGVASITEREITVDLADEALRGVAVVRNRQVTLPDIMGLVTGEFSISARELTGKGRTQAVSLPRQICMYLCRQHTEQSLDEIGRFFGNRDHTTVLYSVQKVGKRVKEDRMFRDLVQSLSTRLMG